VLEFTPNALSLLREVAARLEYPDSCTLEFLSKGNWISAEPVVLVLDSHSLRRSRLPAPTRELVRCLLLEMPEAPYHEIAAIAGCSEKAVATQRRHMAEGR
jgi:hypothetical protein